MNKFWMVWMEGSSHIPTQQFQFLDEAMEEAERRAREVPEATLYILESCMWVEGSVVVDMQYIEEYTYPIERG